MTKTTKIISSSIFVLLVALVLALRFIGQVMTEEDMHTDTVHLVDVVEEGDLIFQTSVSSQSKAIQLATHSQYSHMGIIYKDQNKVFVYEAIQPVKLTPLTVWINRGKDGHCVVKRLKNAESILTASVKTKLRHEGEKYMGKNYDLYFEWTDEKIYCSELVWKMYKEAANVEIGKLERLSDFDLTHQVVEQILSKRYGANIPMDEKVISPSSMYHSKLLRTVYER